MTRRAKAKAVHREQRMRKHRMKSWTPRDPMSLNERLAKQKTAGPGRAVMRAQQKKG